MDADAASAHKYQNAFFLARDSIYAIALYMLSPVRPSTGGSVKDGWS